MESAFAIRFRGRRLSLRGGVFPGFQGLVALAFTWYALFGASMTNAPISLSLIIQVSLCGLIGVSIRSWSIATLKQSFLDTIDLNANQKIITTGPYRYLRHPAEWGTLLALLGASLIGNGFVILVFLIVMVPISLARMLMENRLLSKYR